MSKQCWLTKRPLPSKLEERSLFVIDKTQPVAGSNVVVTTKTMQQALGALQGSCKMTTKTIQVLGKNLIKL